MAMLPIVLNSACFTTRYLTQAAIGQASLIARAKPLSVVLSDPNTSALARYQLRFVPEVKSFGESYGLHPTSNYERYTEIHRSAVVWVVQACQPLAFKPKRWSFPIAGTVPYLGFFKEADARAYGTSISENEQLDVDVRGAPAYSTLGWFKDPILSSMLHEGPEGVGLLANTLLHESVHATVYVPGQSSFNESLASYVAEQLTPKWLSARFGSQSIELTRYQQVMGDSEVRTKLLHQTYQTLDTLYQSSASDEDKRARKKEILAELKSKLNSRRDWNNATLFGFRTYDTSTEAFERLLKRSGGDWTQFFTTLRDLKANQFHQANTDDFSSVLDSL